MTLKHLFLTTALAGALTIGHVYAQDAQQNAQEGQQTQQETQQTQDAQGQEGQQAQGGQQGQGTQQGQAGNQMATRDMSKLTCQELTGMVPADALFTLFWIDGYVSGQAGDAVLEPETFMQHRDRIIRICTAQDAGDRLVLKAVQQAGQ